MTSVAHVVQDADGDPKVMDKQVVVSACPVVRNQDKRIPFKLAKVFGDYYVQTADCKVAP